MQASNLTSPFSLSAHVILIYSSAAATGDVVELETDDNRESPLQSAVE